MNVLQHITDSLNGKHAFLTTRSSQWPEVRSQHLIKQPVCALCGGNKKLSVHHIHPFHLHPELELDPNNLITLCESDQGGVNCHLHIGHLGNYTSYNQDVVQDAYVWFNKIQNRPYE